MKASIWVTQLKFQNGLTLNLKQNSIVVFVGPNNAGKSRTLQEINKLTRSPSSDNQLILKQLKMSSSGSDKSFLELINHRRINNQYHYIKYPSDMVVGSEHEMRLAWNNFSNDSAPDLKYRVADLLVKEMTTKERLLLVMPPKTINFLSDAPSHPIHHLKLDEAKELEFSKHFKLAFDQDVIINHNAGAIIPLHVGNRPTSTAENDRVSKEYHQKLAKLSMLHDQGDGMKSFASVFLGLFVEDSSINILDEPEAFLHPPQATLLGQMIAKSLGNDKQIFLATHSEHVLKGLLDHSTDRLVIVRIQRDGNNNQINVLENEDIKKIWSDSLLRHSNILDGLFHSKVIICESDSDNRFFSALSVAIVEKEEMPAKDILYVHCGGKQRFPIVIKALRKLEVPLTVVGDFDLYNNEFPIKQMYEDVGGSWDDIKTDFKIVKQAIDGKRPELETAQLKDSINNIFSGIAETIMPEEKIKLIEKELKKSSPWTQAKSSGKAYLPAGDSMNSFNRIQAKLQEQGIFILEVGEIEAFDKTIGGHGPKWVNGVLGKNLIEASELTEARTFVKSVILR